MIAGGARYDEPDAAGPLEHLIALRDAEARGDATRTPPHATGTADGTPPGFAAPSCRHRSDGQRWRQLLTAARTTEGPVTTTDATVSDPIIDEVRGRYAEAARAVLDRSPETSTRPSGCCGASTSAGASARSSTSERDRAMLPDAAVLASLGCGNPTAVAELHEGEIVLDLGSGGGIDVLLSAQRVGPTGFAYGLDMTDEMLELARRNAVDAGATNVEFRKGRMEVLPFDDGTVDVVISNCVINLSIDKSCRPRRDREGPAARRPDGRERCRRRGRR